MSIKKLNTTTILDETGETPFVAFPVLRQFDFIKHGFSSRLGGVSEGALSSMNLGFKRGDDDDKVIENYKRICSSIGINWEELVFTDQVHKANVRRVVSADKGKGIKLKRDYQEIDAHITNEINVPLLVFCADCVPIYLVDPVRKAIGLVHSGWRGTALKIGKITIERMQDEFGTKKEDVIAVIGPSIGQGCYEVSKEVAEEFKKSFIEDEVNSFLRKKENDKFNLDLWKANRSVLLLAGLKPEHITISGMCTMCNPKLFFSHRAMGINRGSMAAFMQLV